MSSEVAELELAVDEVPQGWTVEPLSKLCGEVIERVDPAAMNIHLSGHYIGLEHIGQGTGQLVGIGNAADVVSQKSQFHAGDILYGKLRPNLRKVARPDFGGVCSTDIIVFRTKPTADPAFLFQVLQSEPLVAHAIATAAGTKMPRTHARSILSFEIASPPLDEQRRIAEVLRSVDEALALNAATARHLWSLRELALAELFLASAGEEAETTVLGRMPAGWRVVAADTVCEAVIDCKNRTPPITDEGPAVVRTMNVRRGRFVRVNLARTDTLSYFEWTKRGKPQVGDVLITREAPFGEVCAVPHDEPVCLGQRMMLYRPRPSDLHSGYLLYALQSAGVQEHLIRLAGGSTVGHVRVGDIRHLPLPVPDMTTQVAIATAMADIDLALDHAEQAVAGLQSLKASLSADLLFGRVRVPA